MMAECIACAQNGRIFTSGLKSDVTIVFLDPDFLYDAEISRSLVVYGAGLNSLSVFWLGTQ